MDKEQRHHLLRSLMWDYVVPVEDLEAVLSGKKHRAGHYDRKLLFIKMLESYPWFTIIQFFTIEEIKKMLTDDVIQRLRMPSLRNKYGFVKERLHQKDVFLKVEFVNDIEYRSGKVNPFKYGTIDTPFNILSNKLTAIIGRDEAKDVFDIVYLALNYSFNWMKIFNEAKTKAIINEIDIVERLGSFPLEWLNNVDWISKTTDYENFKQALNSLANDFLLGKDNSLCMPGCATIEKAKLLPDLD